MKCENSEIQLVYGSKNKLLILAVTGYTDSGCKSLCDLLRLKDNPFVNIELDHVYRQDYFNKKKLKISQNYLKSEKWNEFYTIKISHIILATTFYMDSEVVDEAFDFVGKTLNISSGKLDDAKKEYIDLKKHYYSNVIERDCCRMEELERFFLSGKVALSDICRTINIFKDKVDVFENFLQSLDELKLELCRKLAVFDKHLYILLFQYFGFRIRKGCRIELKGKPIESNIHFIPQMIYKVINMYRLYDEHIGREDTRIVVETIRNPHEVDYLRSRFSNFYLLAVHKPQNGSLVGKVSSSEFLGYMSDMEAGKVKEALKNLDTYKKCDEEFLDKDVVKYWYAEDDASTAKEFWNVNVSRCIQQADVHLYNAKKSDTFIDLRVQLCWYLALMDHPGLFPPNEFERVMNIAFQAKLNSGCISRQVGAVVASIEYDILSVGWNDVPRGQTPCILRSVEGCLTCKSDDRDYSKYEKVSFYDEGSFRKSLYDVYSRQKGIVQSGALYKGWEGKIPLSYCFKDIQNKKDKSENQVHTRSVHAEENALIQVGKRAIAEGGILFTTSSTCELCSKKAAEMGISKIYYVDPYPGLATKHNLQYENSPELNQFYGAVGLGFYRLYTPVMPTKDELHFYLMQKKYREEIK